MKPYFESSEGEIYHGNVLDVLRQMADESVHMCVTSPPYWSLRDYKNEPQIWDSEPPERCEGGRDHVWGDEIISKIKNNQGSSGTLTNSKQDLEARHDQFKNTSQGQFCQNCGAWRGSLGLEPSPELFIAHMVQIFREVRRVLRKDGVFFLNMGDSYAASGGDRKNGSQGRTSCVGKTEPESNPDKRNRPKEIGLKPKDLIGIPWRLALALQADGWWLRSDIIWHKPNPMPESCQDRPTKAHEYLFLLTKSAKYFYDADAIREPHAEPNRGKGESDRVNWNTGGIIGRGRTGNYENGIRQYNPSGRNKRTVWTIPTQPMPQAHFATFPEKLIEPCILSGTSEKGCCAECGASWERVVESKRIMRHELPQSHPDYRPGRYTVKAGGLDEYNKGGGQAFRESKTTGWKPGCPCGVKEDFDWNSIPLEDLPGKLKQGKPIPCTVLDPFFGSGTSGIVAHKHGRKFIGIELSQKYLDEIAIPRVKKSTRQKGWNRFK